MTVTLEPTAAGTEPTPVRPRWERFGLPALLVGTAVLYLWGLGSTGWANGYYAAAAQAATADWKAWLFGSLDAGNAITVDKPPAALWVMGLSGRVFGFNAFTMLLPQALMGVAAVAVLYATVKRCAGPAAGLIAGTVLALTPVSVMMFRFNNPDALLVLLLVVAAYCTVRAAERGSARWMALTGCVIGFAFLTKMLQALLPVPALALAFLIAAPTGWWKRLGALLIGGLAIIASAGWYIALVSLWPADSRPYIGGSTDNSLVQLTLGYNGLQRIVGGEGPGSGGPGGPGPHPPGGNLFFGGDPGLTRMFGPSFGAEASWLLPAALIGLAALVWLTRRRPRTDALRAQAILWGGWLIVTAIVFSYMDGIVHPYYTVALAPAIAAIVGMAVVELWSRRDAFAARAVLAVMTSASGVWAFILLGRTPDWLPALRWVIVIGAVLAAFALLFGARWPKRATAAVLLSAAVFGLAGSAAIALYNTGESHSGPGTMSGPPQAGARGPGSPGGPGGSGGPGGPGSVRDNPALQELLRTSDTRWAAAGIGSMQVSDLELATGASLMAVGGFTGADPSPTLAQFQGYVADGQVRYFLGDERKGPGGGPGGPGGPRRSGSSAEISEWVTANFTKIDVGGAAVYDLARPLT